MTKELMGRINEIIFNHGKLYWKNDDKIKEIEAKLSLLNISTSKYTINEDYTVNVKGDININSNLKECPVEFNDINGNFIWHFKNLESVKNLPKNVSGNMSISGNNIISLEGLPTKKVTGTFTCSNNKIKNLKGCPSDVGSLICNSCGLESLEGSPYGINKDFLCSNNKLKTLKSDTFYINGIFDCSDNQLSNMKYCPLSSKIKYDNNPLQEEEEEEEELSEPNNLETTNTVLNVGDIVVYKKENSKYDNFKGRIFNISNDEPPKYQIRFSTLDHPGLTKETTILKIDAQNIHKIDNDKNEIDIEKSSNIEIGDDVYLINRGQYYYAKIMHVNKDNLVYAQFSTKEGQKLYYYVCKLNLTLRKKSSNDDKKPDTTDTVKTSYEDKLYCNDKIRYIGNNNNYYGWEGEITSVSYVRNEKTYTIALHKNGSNVYLHQIDEKSLKKIKNTTKKEEKTFKFKMNDKIVYLKPDDPDYNCRGKICCLNEYQKNYDIYIINNGKEIRKNWIEEKYLKIYNPLFEKGDKIIYDDINDKTFYKKIGMIKHSSKTAKNKIIFRVDNKLITLNNIDSDKLIKFEPEDFFLNDDIIYTKLDSKYYGCLGTITGYNLDKVSVDKTSNNIIGTSVDIQIISEDNKKIKIKEVRPCNIEKQPPKREFRKGDIIRYVNINSPNDGLEGEIVKKSKNRYEVILKPRDKEEITILTSNEYLKLLMDSRESENLKYGEKIIYKKEDSKYNNKTGVFKGIRSDGKYEIELDSPYTKLFVDGVYLYPKEEITTTTSTTTTTTTDYTKKKKKKNEEPPRPPVLVYNRRNVARRAGRKQLPQPDETITEQ